MLGEDVPVDIQAPPEFIKEPSMDAFDSNSWLLLAGNFRRKFASLAIIRNVADALIRHKPQNQASRLNIGSIKGPRSRLGPHEIATLESTGKRVLIEYITYQDSWQSREEELVERINTIAYLRSKGLSEFNIPVLQCCGYFHEPSQSHFGIVYRLPQEAWNTDPISFLSLLENKKRKRMPTSLTQRYKLAYALVKQLVDFHRGGWLHKGMASLNIICFPHAIKDYLAAPYFISFNYSQENKDSAFSSPSGPEMKYQHPAYQRKPQAYTDDRTTGIQRFRQEFDYYSVGIVLMEIALWKPLRSIIDSTGVVDSPEKTLDELLKQSVPLMREHMGDIYEAAVRYCLTAYKDRQGSPEDIKKGFDENVVIPYLKCKV